MPPNPDDSIVAARPPDRSCVVRHGPASFGSKRVETRHVITNGIDRSLPSANVPPAERPLSTGEAAKELGIALRTLQRWVREGSIRPTLRTVGGHARFDPDDLRQQLDELQTRRDGF